MLYRLFLELSTYPVPTSFAPPILTALAIVILLRPWLWQLVGKDVWEQLLGDDSGTLPDPAAYPDIVLPPDTNLLGGYKRPRAATSLSSAGDSEMGFLLSSNGDGLANVFSSLELSHLISSGTVSAR